jgi:hypothetical protein
MRSGTKATPLSMMAPWKRLWEMGDTTCEDTLVPPAEATKMVMWLGLPPKWTKFSLTQHRVATLFWYSQVPVTCRSQVLRSSRDQVHWTVCSCSVQLSNLVPGSPEEDQDTQAVLDSDHHCILNGCQYSTIKYGSHACNH